LDETRKATVNVPTEVAQGGYRLRVNGTELPEHAGVLEDGHRGCSTPRLLRP
jgi:hypothetical protein